ncbi:hypothetical protein [Brevibacillus gelatini]|uniref:hypothetical protein n=1 Tax=Brevibacillus gelatini TaxID=1655277 RepID=UPI0011CE130B|nr:hypothetical protein [Brevibacillus gelatini]
MQKPQVSVVFAEENGVGFVHYQQWKMNPPIIIARIQDVVPYVLSVNVCAFFLCMAASLLPFHIFVGKSVFSRRDAEAFAASVSTGLFKKC